MPSTPDGSRTTADAPAAAAPLLRIEVGPAPGHKDPIGEALHRDAAALGIHLTVSRATHIYLIQLTADTPISPAQLETILARVLADPVTESARVGAADANPEARIIEVHPLPGVMDPVAQSVGAAIQQLLDLPAPPRVATGWRYDLSGPNLSAQEASRLAERFLANPVIHRIYNGPFHPDHLPESAAHHESVQTIPIIGLSDDNLHRLSRDAHLFLSLEEMQAIRAHYAALGRDPREIELETLAQTWSEHCVHKTLKSTIRYTPARPPSAPNTQHSALHHSVTPSLPLPYDPITWTSRPGHELLPDGAILIHNLLNSTVAAATHALIADGVDWTLSVFTDNSGVIAFDDDTAVCIKVETHNHPSAIEPYGGAATGAGGCIRDVIGTGLGARPIASTDVFCVASPDIPAIPEGCLHPRRILTQVVAGVRDYGNRMGIPTISGAVDFDDRYVGNPLVFCGCIGVMPRNRVRGRVQPGDLIVALGGRTGRDGIHGATFSSAELEHTATDEFAHAVQIGNAITEKQVLDAIMRARDDFPEPLFSGLTDCGAGGFSSAIGEMGRETGAVVHLDRAPLKYAGLSPTEIWISEAQERMVLAVPEANLARLSHICDQEGAELAVLGTFSSPPVSDPRDPELQLLYHGGEVGRLSMGLLHDGLPTPHREATWSPAPLASSPASSPQARSTVASTPDRSLTDALLAILAHPTVASKHWIIRQYDHEVRGTTILKPLVGPLARGPGDASVITPVPGSRRALAVSCGLATGIGDPEHGGDPYLMVLAAIDECVRNLVCVGADPDRIAILDNFCWPSCRKPENVGSLVRAAEGCYDGALAYRTPFVSGKDSLNNQFATRDGRVIEIPPTLLITGIGIITDIEHACTMDAKAPGNTLILVGNTQARLGGSIYQRLFDLPSPGPRDTDVVGAVPTTDLRRGPTTARTVAGLIRDGLVAAAHDASDGGLLPAISEMLIAGSTPAHPIGAQLDLRMASGDPTAAAFSESPSRYVLEATPEHTPRVRATLRARSIPHVVLGHLNDSGILSSIDEAFEPIPVERLAQVWLSPLDW